MFRPGDASCMMGAGVYFAERPEDAVAKAHRHGVILVADVFVGNSLLYTDNRCDKSMTAKN